MCFVTEMSTRAKRKDSEKELTGLEWVTDLETGHVQHKWASNARGGKSIIFEGYSGQSVPFNKESLSLHLTGVSNSYKKASDGVSPGQGGVDGSLSGPSIAKILMELLRLIRENLLSKFDRVEGEEMKTFKLFKLLDLGCGTGMCMLQFSCAFDKCEGIELVANMRSSVSILNSTLVEHMKKMPLYDYCDIEMAFGDLTKVTGSESFDGFFTKECSSIYTVVYSFCKGITGFVEALKNVVEDHRVVFVVLASYVNHLKDCEEVLMEGENGFDEKSKFQVSAYASPAKFTLKIYIRKVYNNERAQCGASSGSTGRHGEDEKEHGGSRLESEASDDDNSSASRQSSQASHKCSMDFEGSDKGSLGSPQGSPRGSPRGSSQGSPRDSSQGSSQGGSQGSQGSRECSLDFGGSDSDSLTSQNSPDTTLESAKGSPSPPSVRGSIPHMPVTPPALEVLPGVYSFPRIFSHEEFNTLARFLERVVDYVYVEGRCRSAVNRGHPNRLEIDLGFLCILRRAGKGLRCKGHHKLIDRHFEEAMTVLGLIDRFHDQSRRVLEYTGVKDPETFNYHAYVAVSLPGTPPQVNHTDVNKNGKEYMNVLTRMSPNSEPTEFVIKDRDELTKFAIKDGDEVVKFIIKGEHVIFPELYSLGVRGDVEHRGPAVPENSSRRILLSLVICSGLDINRNPDQSIPFRSGREHWPAEGGSVGAAVSSCLDAVPVSRLAVEPVVDLVDDQVDDKPSDVICIPDLEDEFLDKVIKVIKAQLPRFELESREKSHCGVYACTGVFNGGTPVEIYASPDDGSKLHDLYLYRESVAGLLGRVRAYNNPFADSVFAFRNKHSFARLDGVSFMSLKPLDVFLPGLIESTWQEFMKDGFIQSEWKDFMKELLDAICFSHWKNVAHLGLCPEVIKRQSGTGKLKLVGWGHSRFLSDVKYVKEPEDNKNGKSKKACEFPKVEAFPKDSILRSLGVGRGGTVGVPGFTLRRKINTSNDGDLAKHADLWAAASICLLPFLPGDVEEMQKKLHKIEVDAGEFEPGLLLPWIKDSLTSHGAGADALRVVDIAVDIALGRAKDNPILEVRAWHLHNMVSFACDLLNNDVCAKNSLAKPFLSNYIADSRELERALVVDGVIVCRCEEIKKSQKSGSKEQIPVLVMQIAGMGLNAFTLFKAVHGDTIGFYGGELRPKSRRDSPPSSQRMNFHTLVVSGGEEIDGSPEKLCVMLKAGIAGSLFASSWKDHSTPAKGNVEVDPLKQKMLQFKFDGVDISAVEMSVGVESISVGEMLNWSYNFTAVCDYCPLTQKELDAMVSSYKEDPSKFPHVMEAVAKARTLMMAKGYADSC